MTPINRLPLLARRGGAKRRGGGSRVRFVWRYMDHHPVCAFGGATPPGQRGQSLFYSTVPVAVVNPFLA